MGLNQKQKVTEFQGFFFCSKSSLAVELTAKKGCELPFTGNLEATVGQILVRDGFMLILQ